VHNILIANNAVSLEYKMNRLRDKCSLCQKRVESLEHVFLECEISLNVFKKLKFEEEIKIKKETILLNMNLNDRDSFLISVYKYVIWKVRNLCKYKENINRIIIAEKLISKWLTLK
jgi:hypothetical protein